MIEFHDAAGSIPTFLGTAKHADMQKNRGRLESVVKTLSRSSILDIGVRLLAIPEGAARS